MMTLMKRAWAIVGQILVCGMMLCAKGVAAASGETATDTNLGAAVASAPESKNLVNDGPAFEVQLGVAGVAVCVVFPEVRRDEPNCAGVDTAAVEASIERLDRSNLIAAAMLHEQQSETVVMVMKVPFEMAKISGDNVQKTANEFLKGMAKSTSGAVSGLEQPARLFQVGPLQVLHMRIAMHPVKDASELAFLSDNYMVLTAGNTRLIQFITLAQNLPAMQPVMDRLIQGVRGKPTQKLSSDDAEAIGYKIGYATGPFVFPILLIVALVVGGTLVARRGRRRKPVRSDTPPGSN